MAKHKNTRKEGMTLLQFVFPGVLLVCAGAERRLLRRGLPFFFFVEKNSSNSWLKVLGKAVRIYEFFFFFLTFINVNVIVEAIDRADIVCQIPKRNVSFFFF